MGERTNLRFIGGVVSFYDFYNCKSVRNRKKNNSNPNLVPNSYTFIGHQTHTCGQMRKRKRVSPFQLYFAWIAGTTASRLYLIKNFRYSPNRPLIPLSHAHQASHTFFHFSLFVSIPPRWSGEFGVMSGFSLFFFSPSIWCSKLIERRKIEQKILENLTFIKLWIRYLNIFLPRILWYFS